MDNFNLHKYYTNSYIKEAMGDDDSIRAKINDLQKQHEPEIKSKFKDYRPYISMGFYGTDRPDNDKYKGKGFGKLDFVHRDELPDNVWKDALNWVKSKGYEVSSDSNYYEIEFDGDRAWYPAIKFEFLAKDILL
jgi:hypothetical protein